MNVLETRNLHFSYDKKLNILENINIQVCKGSFVGLLGSNGCGKTTLTQLLNRLLKPTRGSVLLRGKDLKDLKDQDIYSSIGLVFQNPDDQLFEITVSDDIAYGVKNLGIKGEELKNRINHVVRILGISDLKDKEIHKLSFGQKKKVALAGVLAMKPEILILDEPTAGLDPLSSSHLIGILQRIQEENNTTIIIATHEVDIVPVACNYVYVLSKGNVILEGDPEEVFKNKTVLRQCNLRLPRIGHLMEILNEKDDIEIDISAMTISKARQAIKRLYIDNKGDG